MTDLILMALYGASVAVFAIAALLFARYRVVHRDRLFGFFAAAFGCFSVGFVVRVVTGIDEHRAFIFIPRLVGFLLIIVAIFDKNRRARRSS